jgi:biotin synthase
MLEMSSEMAATIAPSAEADHAFDHAWDRASLFQEAAAARNREAKPVVHLRAVIEFTNLCHRNCLYCGMRMANKGLERYEMGGDDILGCAERAWNDGLKTVMIQGGDHLTYDIDQMCKAVRVISEGFGQAVMLSLGDRPLRDYETLYAAGARQALVKFETSNDKLYRRMRPHNTLEKRLGLISSLKNMGYDMSSGFILGLPGSTRQDVERDLALIKELPLFAASVSPFVPNDQAPLANQQLAGLDETLECIARIRLGGPKLRVPAVSALNLLAKAEGRAEPGQLLGLLAGANNLTINYTPSMYQDAYVIYATRRSIVQLEFAKQIVSKAELEIV